MKRAAWFLGLLAMTAGAGAQSTADGLKNLQSDLLNKPAMLRGFSADAETHWTWNGIELTQKTPKLFMLGVLVPTSIEINDNTLLIRGNLHTLMRGKDTKIGITAEFIPVKIFVTSTAPDMTQLLPALTSRLFYPTVGAALADLPSPLRTKLPISSTDDFLAAKKSQKDNTLCDCKVGVCATNTPMKNEQPPKLLTSNFYFDGVPYSGTKALYFLRIDERGKIADVWIVQPIWHGYDSQIAANYRGYDWAPATCHGQPVSSDLYIGRDLVIR